MDIRVAKIGERIARDIRCIVFGYRVPGLNSFPINNIPGWPQDRMATRMLITRTAELCG